jgi:hypothetical protein
MSYPTLDSWIPNPMLPIIVKNISRCKHGSDVQVFGIIIPSDLTNIDNEGRFTPQKFAEIFSKYSNGKEGLDFNDIMRMTNHTRNIWDVTGFIAAKIEWLSLWLLSDGLVTREMIRSQYDGTLFYHLKRQNAMKKKLKKHETNGPDELRKEE